MTSFKLASNLLLPASAVTETFAYVGTRGSGKTYACGKMIEAFYDGGIQVVVVDPVGVMYGLRLAANGKGRGLDVPVFGGVHGDVPLEPTGGELVARLIVEKRMSVVLDVSLFTLGQQHRFVTAFATTLFNLKKTNRSPLHVVFEEAHEFIPQVVGGAEAEMVGAVKRLWKIGRNFGIGGTLVSQRPAEINKGAFNLTERMFCGRLKGVQDRKAIESWASSNDADMTVLDALPTLKSGDLIFWTDAGAERVRFLPKRTFDASKTPEAGDTRPSASLPAIDLDEVRTAMAATIEEAKANDPKALRARIAELERAAKAPTAPTAPTTTKTKTIAAADLLRIERLITKLATGEQVMKDITIPALDTARDRLAQQQQAVVSELGNLRTMVAKAVTPVSVPTPVAFVPSRAPPVRRQALASTNGESESHLSRCARALLDVLASRGVATDSQVSALSGYRKTSSGFSNALSELRTRGLIDGHRDRLTITEAGRAITGAVPEPPTGKALLDYWTPKLTKAEAALLRALYDAGGSASREELSTATGYSMTSSGFSNSLSGLRTLDLASGPNGGGLTIADVFK